jgi:DNA-binding NarL/FixJ family response regulator
METGKIKIIIADDHKIMREGLKCLLDRLSNVKTIGEADNGRMALELAIKLNPDVIVMDVSMPDLNGIEATRQIKKELSSTKVIGLSMHSDKRFVKEMLMAGASGYLLKHNAFEELEHAIHAAVANRVYLSPEITEVVVSDYIHKENNITEEADVDRLTHREKEILQLLAEGNTTKDISSHLNISIKTVETHRQNIMEKLNVHSIADLTKYALMTGLTTLEK